MKISEFDDTLYEMSNYDSNTTGLDNSITMWVRAEPNKLNHSNYRVKFEKDNMFSAIYTVSSNPVIAEETKNKKYMLSNKQKQKIVAFIKKFRSLIIGHIDAKLDSTALGLGIIKDRNDY